MTISTYPATAEEGIRLLNTYTAGSFNLWVLAGHAKANVRARVMTGLLGKKAPQSKSGVNAIRDEFERQLGIVGGTASEREDEFIRICRLLSKVQP